MIEMMLLMSTVTSIGERKKENGDGWSFKRL